MSESGKNRREKAAAARSQAQSAEKRRERTIRIVGAVTVVAVVVAIIGVAVVARNSSPSGSATANPTAAADPSAALPKGAFAATEELAFGVAPYGLKEGVPVLAIWEDFQCPACKAVEDANGAGIRALAESGAVQLVYRPTAFLDANLQNDSSTRAIAAFGCAVDAGKAADFHDVVYKNQPEKEGTGYTDEQLLQFGADAGITGADYDTYKACFEARTYLPWAANTTSAFYASKVPGTPYATLNGAPLESAILADAAKLQQAVADAAAGKLPAPAASPSAS